MTTEEIKLILETLSAVSDNASTAVMTWVVLHYATQIFTAIATAGVIGYSIYVITRGIVGTVQWSEAGKAVSVAYGGGDGPFMYDSSRQAIQRAIERSRNKREKK